LESRLSLTMTADANHNLNQSRNDALNDGVHRRMRKPSSHYRLGLLGCISWVSGSVISLFLALVVHADDTTASDDYVVDYSTLGWVPRSQLSIEEQETLPAFCRGMYRDSDIIPLKDKRIEAEADEATLQKSGEMALQGDVVFRQEGQILNSDYANWAPESRVANFRGNVSIQSAGMMLGGDSANFNDSTGDITLNRSAYVITNKHLRGLAGNIHSPQDNELIMTDATLTFCEPGRNDWDFATSELSLNQDAGFGTAWHARLRVKEVPVFYIPYYRFPIDDRRLTGFLDPGIALNGMGQAEDIQIPFYLNLAPNLDATIIAHHVLDHGVLWENQLRHKTALLGDGELNYGILGTDKETKEERSLLNYQQSGTWGSRWSHNWVYSKVSDNDYFSDMNSSAAVDRTTHLPRRGTIQYQAPQINGNVLIESFQTTDETITLSNRPYRRLPQLNLILTPATESTWTLKQTLQATRFNRESSAIINESEQTLSGFAAFNGDRLVSDSSISYPLRRPYGFLTPTVEYRHRAYRLYDSSAEDDIATEPSFGASRMSLDGSLVFERETSAFSQSYTQTLEPRLFYVHSPYKENQEDIPAFDTKATSVTFNSLFTGDRFTGGDRLADLNQLSTGLTTRYIRDDGLEQFRVSAGSIWYFKDREVTLSGAESSYQERHTSSILAESEWNPTSDWSVFSFVEWDPYQDYSRQERHGVRFSDDMNHMLSVSSTKLDNRDPDTGTESNSHQLDVGLYWALSDHWAIFGRQLRDLRAYETNELRPEDKVLESLAGLEYQSCCWRAQLMYRETSPRSTDTEFTTEKRFGWMLSIQLKGLTTLGSGTDELLSDSIYGYSRRLYHDY
jgi:LPS-assembly protein